MVSCLCIVASDKKKTLLLERNSVYKGHESPLTVTVTSSSICIFLQARHLSAFPLFFFCFFFFFFSRVQTCWVLLRGSFGRFCIISLLVFVVAFLYSRFCGIKSKMYLGASLGQMGLDYFWKGKFEGKSETFIV